MARQRQQVAFIDHRARRAARSLIGGALERERESEQAGEKVQSARRGWLVGLLRWLEVARATFIGALFYGPGIK